MGGETENRIYYLRKKQNLFSKKKAKKKKQKKCKTKQKPQCLFPIAYGASHRGLTVLEALSWEVRKVGTREGISEDC